MKGIRKKNEHSTFLSQVLRNKLKVKEADVLSILLAAGNNAERKKNVEAPPFTSQPQLAPNCKSFHAHAVNQSPLINLPSPMNAIFAPA